jgi:hypothetical protein
VHADGGEAVGDETDGDEGEEEHTVEEEEEEDRGEEEEEEEEEEEDEQEEEERQTGEEEGVGVQGEAEGEVEKEDEGEREEEEHVFEDMGVRDSPIDSECSRRRLPTDSPAHSTELVAASPGSNAAALARAYTVICSASMAISLRITVSCSLIG